MATGRWQNGLFGGVIVANSGIGIIQELRAKRVLDGLALLHAPQVRVLRDGRSVDLAAADIVLDDLVEIGAGDQVPADGSVVRSEALEIDESLLSGESEPLLKAPGDAVLSGSVVVAGTGAFHATAVGSAAYANVLATEARRFTTTRSELVEGTERILRWISVMLVVVGPVLLWSQFRSSDNHGWRDALSGAVAGMVGMVPEGLVLLTSLAFVVATVGLARQQTLVQELSAVEGLARVDVLCLDKTGTLTHGDVALGSLETLEGFVEAEVREALALLSPAEERGATARALADSFPDGSWTAVSRIPFSSARKWSAVTTAAKGSWVLGAPEVLLPTPRAGEQATARDAAAALAQKGDRVLLLAKGEPPSDETGTGPRTADLRPAALVVLKERLREDAAQALTYFAAQGVAVKIISGDNPRTVGSVAVALGVPGAERPVDARTLAEDGDELAAAIREHSVFGRATPQQKRAFVAALQRDGHVVAMTGDGVNDALALKDADIGIAMGSGSPATRAVAQLVLLDDRFSHLPGVVAQGRRVIANIERASNLFLVKNTYALVLAVIATATLGAYPLAPVQLTLISTLTIGVPGFVLALGPNTRRYAPGFLGRVLRFSLPIGVITGLSAYVGYGATRLLGGGASVAEGQTSAAIVVLIVSTWTVGVLARPLTGAKLLVVGALAASVTLLVAVPAIGRSLFLITDTSLDLTVAILVGAAGAFLVECVHRAGAHVHRGGS
jgi:cation-transporting ATPase E